tara:strand:- start:779 stop:1690 length:912 start_codon:yes stop_codon:yes gene_type:complete
MNKQYQNICDKVTKKVISFLDEGVIPWKKPWKGGALNMPRSASTKKVYRGTNLGLLASCGYNSPWWMTFKQAQNLGGKVLKGSKSMPVVYWKFHDPKPCYKCSGGNLDCSVCDGTGKYTPFPSVFYSNVFNADQVEGLPEKYNRIITKEDDLNEFENIKSCDDIINNYQDSPKIYHDQNDRCFYRPSSDEVHMVKPEKFISDEEYYSTLFHELIHSTGHAKRCNRDGVTKGGFFGSHEYSKEELVAELGSTFLCGIAGIERDEVIKNSASYISSWKSKLSKNTDWIMWAGSRSSKACEHILNK